MRRLGRMALAGVLAGALPLGMAAGQQKPPALGQPAPSPGGKFTQPPAAPAPAPAPRVDKFAQPPAPPTSPAPPSTAQGGKFGPESAPPRPVAPPPPGEPATIGQLRTLLGPDTSLTYGKAEVIDPARGSVRLSDVTLERPGDHRATMEELTLDGLRDDGVGEATARGIVLREPDGGATISRLRLAGLTVRRPPPGEELQPDMLSLDTLRIEGLAATGESEVGIAELTIEDYGSGRTGRVTLSGLDVRTQKAGMLDRVRVSHVALRGIDLAATLAALVAKTSPPQPTGSYALEVEGVALAAGDRPLGSLGSLRMTGEGAGGGPETGTVALREIRVEPFPGLAEWLQRFGYQALVADLTAESRYDRSTGRVDLSSLSLAARDIGALGLSMVLDGVTPQAAEAQDLQAMRLVSLGLRYVDQSLYSRFVREQARQTRRTEQQVRDQHAAMVGAMLNSSAKGGALDGLRDAVLRFIRGEAKEVEITARPPQPLPFADLAAMPPHDAAAAQQMLGLSATAR